MYIRAMTMSEEAYAVNEARQTFSELCNKVHYTGQPITITKRGRPIVRIVPAAGDEGESEADR